jgi:hypothetical protein
MVIFETRNMNPVRRQSALLYANVSGDPATNVTLSQKNRAGEDPAAAGKPNHMTLYPIGFHPLDETIGISACRF